LAHKLGALLAASLPGDRAVLTVPQTRITRTLARLRRDHRVRYAGREHIWRTTASSSPNDPGYVQSLQQNLTAIDATGAWARTHGGVPVAVLDSGVDTSHPDLAGKIIQLGETVCYNNATGWCSAWNYDPYGHGTFASGIIAGATNNGVGIAGTGWDTQVKMFKVLGDDGNGSTIDVATAVINATNEGFRVINLSMAGPSCRIDPNNCGADVDSQAAIDYALSKGVVVVAAAGNGQPGDNWITYPGGYPGVISVAATDNNGWVLWFSQYGSWVTMAAPGLFIQSTIPGGAALGRECYSGQIPAADGYEACSGTSFAAPEVAAAAALVLSAHPSLSGADVAGRLKSSAQPITGGSPIGGGLLDMGKAVGS
jgi:thermitase